MGEIATIHELKNRSIQTISVNDKEHIHSIQVNIERQNRLCMKII